MSSRSRAPRASRNALTRRTAEMEGAGHRSAARRSGGRKVERAARGRGASGRSGGAGRGRPGGDRRGSWLKIGLLGLLAGVLSVSGIYVVKTTFVRQSATVAGISFLAGLSVTIPALLRAVRADVVRILR